MTKKNFYDIIREPILSEKSNFMEALGKYCFIVDKKTDKRIAKRAIESIFNVSISNINILNVKKKEKVFKGIKGYKPGFKKIIVTVKGRKKIEFLKGI